MLGLVTAALALSLPINAREHYRQKINIKIQCWHSILDSPSLSWRERENAFENLSTLYYEQYVLDNVPDADYFPPIDLSLFDKSNDTEIDYTWFDLDH